MDLVQVFKCPNCSEEKSKQASRFVYETVSTEQMNATDLVVEGVQNAASFIEDKIPSAKALTDIVKKNVQKLSVDSINGSSRAGDVRPESSSILK